MKRIILILIIGIFSSLSYSYGQVTKVKAIDFIVLTTEQRDALPSTTDVRLIYNISNVQFEHWNGTNWVAIGGGSGTLTLQEAFNNSSNPEIKTSPTQLGFTLWNGNASNEVNMFEILNISGSNIFEIRATGEIHVYNQLNIDAGNKLNLSNDQDGFNSIHSDLLNTFSHQASSLIYRAGGSGHYFYDGDGNFLGNVFAENFSGKWNGISDLENYLKLNGTYNSDIGITTTTDIINIESGGTNGTYLEINDFTGEVTTPNTFKASNFIAQGKTIDDILLGDGSTSSLSAKQDIPFINKTGTIIDLSNTGGNLMNIGSPNATATYTVTGAVTGGNATLPVDTTGMTAFPSVTTSTLIGSSNFEANILYDLEVRDTGAGIEHYFIRKSAGGGAATSKSYMHQHQSRIHCLTTNDWIGMGTYGLGNNYLATSKGVATAPVYNDSDIGMIQLPTGAVIDKVEIMQISVSAEITDMDFTMSAIGTDITTETNGLVEDVIVAPTSLNTPTGAGTNGVWTILTPNYILTDNKTITYAFKPVGTLTATRYMVYTIQLYYTIP